MAATSKAEAVPHVDAQAQVGQSQAQVHHMRRRHHRCFLLQAQAHQSDAAEAAAEGEWGAGMATALATARASSTARLQAATAEAATAESLPMLTYDAILTSGVVVKSVVMKWAQPSERASSEVPTILAPKIARTLGLTCLSNSDATNAQKTGPK